MLSIVCWKWKPPAGGYRSAFDARAVNTLASMVRRHYPHPHRMICVTDDAAGIDSAIDIVPLWNDHATLQSPHGGHNPSCYRRLRAFAPDAAQFFGPRFVSLDLDTLIVGDMSPVWNRSEDFIIWGETDPRSWYNGSMWMMTAGARPQVWEKFNPRTSPREAFRAGRFGSDQGWISHILGKREATWGRADGVYSYRVHIAPQANALPADARIVMFHGRHDPWDYNMQAIDWVREHYR